MQRLRLSRSTAMRRTIASAAQSVPRWFVFLGCWVALAPLVQAQSTAWPESPVPAQVVSGLSYRMLGGVVPASDCDYCPDCGAWRCESGLGGCACDQPGAPVVPWPPGYHPAPGEGAPIWDPREMRLDQGAPTPQPDGQAPSGEPVAPQPDIEPAPGLGQDLTSPNQMDLQTANQLAGLSPDLGAGEGLMGDVRMLGDFFGGGGAPVIVIERVPTQLQAIGTVIEGSGPGDPNASIDFNVIGSSTQVSAVDFFSVGPGIDTNGDDNADTFSISEPIPPTDAPTSPGPDFGFDGGLAVNPTGTFVDGDVWDVNYSYSRPVQVIIPDPSRGGLVVGKVKLAENGSPLPRNRLFFNYSYFDDVPLVGGGIGVSRFTPGFETTFLNQMASLEMRVPMASTLDSQIFINQASPDRGVELGDLFFTLKFLLLQTDTWAFASGLSFTIPTADDLVVSNRNQGDLLRIENEAVHLMPFIGWRCNRTDRFFWQGFLQWDFDAAGYQVQADLLGTGLRGIGRLHDVSTMYTDIGWYYLLYESQARRGITGVVPSVELHYNRSLESTEVVRAGIFQVGRVQEDIQQLNLAFGSTFFLGPRRSATIGYVNPVGNGADRSFDGELRVLTNWNF